MSRLSTTTKCGSCDRSASAKSESFSEGANTAMGIAGLGMGNPLFSVARTVPAQRMARIVNSVATIRRSLESKGSLRIIFVIQTPRLSGSFAEIFFFSAVQQQEALERSARPFPGRLRPLLWRSVFLNHFLHSYSNLSGYRSHIDSGSSHHFLLLRKLRQNGVKVIILH